MSDNWETPPEAFQFLAESIDLTAPGQVIWDPFFSTGRAKVHLEAAFPDHTIIHEDRDFFQWTPDRYDCVITNPPFSIRKRITEEMIARGKPFAMLIRHEGVFTGYMQKYYREHPDDLQVLIPPKRINFIDPETGKVVPGVRFHSVWVLYRFEAKVGSNSTTVPFIFAYE